MDITVISRSAQRRLFLQRVSEYFAQELNLRSSTYSVEIRSVNWLLKTDGALGCVTKVGPKHVIMVIDSTSNLKNLLSTLAHEWVHVKQIARGQLKTITRRGKTVKLWRGRACKNDPITSPWEQEAYRRETVLAMNLFSKIAKGLTQ